MSYPKTVGGGIRVNGSVERPVITISIGDPAGIGPEIVVKALNSSAIRETARWIIVGEAWLVNSMLPSFEWAVCESEDELYSKAQQAEVVVLDSGLLNQSQHTYGRISAESGRAGLEYVRTATQLCLCGVARAIVTAPLNKEAVALTGQSFCGHTEFIAELCGVDESRMMLWNEQLAVVHVSTHICLEAATRLNAHRIQTTIELGDQAYHALRGKRPRIAVCGLNPHAGENGLFGKEEQRFIFPAISAAQANSIDCRGPFPADTLFLNAFKGAYDMVIAMYHDQGHIPMKLMDFDHTVNVTLGLPIVRTSVDHGTAFDIAGKNLANADDMVCAMQLAVKLAACKHGVAI